MANERLSGAASFCRASPTAWLQLARGRALAIAVNRPERNGAKELVPRLLVQAQYLFADRLVPWREGREMGYENCLQFYVSFEAHAVEQGVVERDPTALVSLKREVPDYAARPWVQLSLADGERRRADAASPWKVSDASHARSRASAAGVRRSKAEEGQTPGLVSWGGARCSEASFRSSYACNVASIAGGISPTSIGRIRSGQSDRSADACDVSSSRDARGVAAAEAAACNADAAGTAAAGARLNR
eukprot:1445183-Pleurochrysis_carterae.AAC.2